MNDSFEIFISIDNKNLIFEAVKGKEHYRVTFYNAILDLDSLHIYFEEFINDYNEFLSKKIEVLEE